MLERDLWLKTTNLLVFLLWLVKSLKNMYFGLLNTSRNKAFCWFPVLFQVFSFNCRSSDSCIWLIYLHWENWFRFFDRVWYDGLLQKLMPYGVTGQVFHFILLLLNFSVTENLEWFFYFLIAIHSTQNWTGTTRSRITWKQR